MFEFEYRQSPVDSRWREWRRAKGDWQAQWVCTGVYDVLVDIS